LTGGKKNGAPIDGEISTEKAQLGEPTLGGRIAGRTCPVKEYLAHFGGGGGIDRLRSDGKKRGPSRKRADHEGNHLLPKKKEEEGRKTSARRKKSILFLGLEKKGERTSCVLPNSGEYRIDQQKIASFISHTRGLEEGGRTVGGKTLSSVRRRGGLRLHARTRKGGILEPIPKEGGF